MQIELLFQNDDILVINKPAGLPVHAGTGGGPNLEDFLPQFQFDKKHMPHLAHRLDRDTGGCLILGRSKDALRRLGKLFEQGRIQKTYWAVVEGNPTENQGRIDAKLAKITQQKTRWHMRVDANGQTAISDYRVLDRHDGKAWLELKPKTGRTHQLRVHCAHMGWPIIGDTLYGSGTNQTQPLLLHARALRIPLDPQAPIMVEAPPSTQMKAFLSGFSAYSDGNDKTPSSP